MVLTQTLSRFILEMRRNEAMMLQLSVLLCFIVPLTSGLKMPFLEKNITNEDIFLRLEDVQGAQPNEFKKGNFSFSGKGMKSNLTLDERCRLGHPLSVRWTNYGPYGSLIRGRNLSIEEGFGLTGIFPRVINKVLQECCHEDTKVVYGNFIETLKDLEKSLSRKDSPNDMVFPVGLQSMDLDRFKDLPVVPLLVAPRTTLVVPESSSEQQGKTFLLFKTVGLAWPILVFIFLAAILSGVFIWVLVSGQRHNTTRHDTTRHNTTRHDTTQHNTTRHDTTQHNTTRHETTQHDTT
jgi:hypothetical protein